MKITPEIASRMYEIAVQHCGAPPSYADTFVRYATGSPSGEYRFQGSLGFGGKLYFDADGWRISCYPEDETPTRRSAMCHANAALTMLREECEGGK